MNNEILNIGHSPDADDAFMFYALFNKKISVDFTYKENIQEIQKLNQDASKKKLDFTAVSVYAYLEGLYSQYDILSCGASIGNSYGPIVVAKKKLDFNKINNLRIAIPGNKTTAYLLMRYFSYKENIFLNEYFYFFSDVIKALENDEVDLAILIHEKQVSYESSSLYKIIDLGEYWYAKEKMVIPLGINIVLNQLNLSLKKNLNTLLKKSVQYAFNHEEEALRYALKYSRGVDPKILLKFIRMYVNEYTLDFGDDGEKAIYRLFEVAKEIKMIKNFNLSLKIIR